ncbi:hypothetical protein PG988_004443 [Apiospora saccharicola]
MLEQREENTGFIYYNPLDTDNGFFIYPRVFAERFRESSSVNISWRTQYDAVNLYFYQRGKVAASTQLTTNLAARWFQWQVRVQETNLTEPYVFRILNAFGTSEEQTDSGFWSSSFYVMRDPFHDFNFNQLIIQSVQFAQLAPFRNVIGIDIDKVSGMAHHGVPTYDYHQLSVTSLRTVPVSAPVQSQALPLVPLSSRSYSVA